MKQYQEWKSSIKLKEVEGHQKMNFQLKVAKLFLQVSKGQITMRELCEKLTPLIDFHSIDYPDAPDSFKKLFRESGKIFQLKENLTENFGPKQEEQNLEKESKIDLFGEEDDPYVKNLEKKLSLARNKVKIMKEIQSIKEKLSLLEEDLKKNIQRRRRIRKNS
jgi:hypothetical protein